MANKIFVVAAVAVCILQMSIAGPAPQKPVVPSIPSILEDLSQHTSEFIKGFGDQVSEVLSAKDAVQLQAIIQNNTQIFAKRVADVTRTLQERLQTSNVDVARVYNQVVENLNQTVVKLQTQNPELTIKVKRVEENIQKSLKTVMGEADRVAKTIAESTKGIQDDLAKIVRQAYENALQTAQALQKQLHEAANKS